MQQQHICGKVLNVDWFSCRGEIILDVHDPETGEQVEQCPECGEEIFQNRLFDLDIFAGILVKMDEFEMMEV